MVLPRGPFSSSSSPPNSLYFPFPFTLLIINPLAPFISSQQPYSLTFILSFFIISFSLSFFLSFLCLSLFSSAVEDPANLYLSFLLISPSLSFFVPRARFFLYSVSVSVSVTLLVSFFLCRLASELLVLRGHGALLLFSSLFFSLQFPVPSSQLSSTSLLHPYPGSPKSIFLSFLLHLFHFSPPRPPTVLLFLGFYVFPPLSTFFASFYFTLLSSLRDILYRTLYHQPLSSFSFYFSSIRKIKNKNNIKN